eukprot:4586391-Prorocentrum_lima.AAC.1
MAGEAANSRRRTLALVTLVLQNTALVICMRISRTADGPIYYSSTAVASMEVSCRPWCSSLLSTGVASLRFMTRSAAGSA